MPRIFQVEYMTRPDEREHIEQFDDFHKACRLAREMSNKHDGYAVVCALDPRPDAGLQATGHIEFVFGMVREQVGTLETVVKAAAAATMANIRAGLTYDVVKCAWVAPEDLTIKPRQQTGG